MGMGVRDGWEMGDGERREKREKGERDEREGERERKGVYGD